MKISVKDIPPKGLDLSEAIDHHDIGLLDEDMTFTTPITVHAHIERIVNSVTADVETIFTLSFICDRCLKSYNKEQKQDYMFNYIVENGMHFIDLGEDIRQEIMLNLPQKHLCKTECKGICPGCGVDLNTEKCKCQMKPGLMERSEHKSDG